MLSYLHAYHAGNFADILKHATLVHTLEYLNQKPAPYFYMDTHSGPGLYTLSAENAQKNCEYKNGIEPIWQQKSLPTTLHRYRNAIKDCNALDGNAANLSLYPGSPWLAAHLCRDQDRLTFCELHPRESQTLIQNFKGDRRIKMFSKDGFQAAIAAMPPKERRGMVLIDPPYEIKTDYERVVEVIQACHKRFATGTYAIWYPVVNRHTIDKMLKALKATGIRNIQVFELGLEKDTSGRGMTSSGMIYINPPWTLWKEMETCLPYLADLLGNSQGAGKAKGVYKMTQLAEE